MKPFKLDGRHSGFKDFKYGLSFVSKEAEQFCKIREWCWQQFGPSAEMDFWYKAYKDANVPWCWINDNWKTKLYFATEKEYQWFLLKWT